MSLKNAVACIRKNKRFLVTTHTSPEGDALGSELAFCRLLQRLGKTATIINEDDTPCEYEFMSAKDKIKKLNAYSSKIEFDCLVILDCSDLRRTGEVYRLNNLGRPVLNIDHHISNEGFADINWVEPDASSCSEMVYKLFRPLRVALDKEAAFYLYIGMMSDTGSFRYNNTTRFTHRVVSELMKFGLNPYEIYTNIYGNIPYQDIQLLLKVLPSMRCEMGGKIIWFEIPRNVVRHKVLHFDLSEHILSFGRSIKGAQVVLLFRENLGEKNEVRVNFRSQGAFDVNKIASYFGGGGHRTASGATIRGSIAEVKRYVLAKIKEHLK